MHSMLSAEVKNIIKSLRLEPHPEGGFYRETFRDRKGNNKGKFASTAIYFLIIENHPTRWHKIKSSEVWHWYAGSPLKLYYAAPHSSVKEVTLGFNLQKKVHPQYCVPAGWWQKARTLGAWTLVGCTVAPGFCFKDLILAPENENPPFS